MAAEVRHYCHRHECRERENKENEYSSCAKCRTARYCSKECQRIDWPDHKKDCGVLYNKAVTRPKGYVEAMLAVIFVLGRKSQYCVLEVDFRRSEMPPPEVLAPATLLDLRKHGLTPELEAKMDPAGRYAFVKDVTTGVGTLVSV